MLNQGKVEFTRLRNLFRMLAFEMCFDAINEYADRFLVGEKRIPSGNLI